MSSNDEPLVAQFFSAFNHADWEGILSVLAKDVRLQLNGREVASGQEAFTEHLSAEKLHFLEVFSDTQLSAIDTGGVVNAGYVVSGQYLSTAPGLPPARGQHYRLEGVAQFEIRDGAIVRIGLSHDDAARASQIADD